ncbi:hypothetical protein CQA72_29695, partial [Klebsiella pneumoniae]
LSLLDKQFRSHRFFVNKSVPEVVEQVSSRSLSEPFLSLLDKQFRSHRFFVNKSVPEVVEQVSSRSLS